MMALRSPLATCAASAVATPRRVSVRTLRAARLVVRAEQQQEAAPEVPVAAEPVPVAAAAAAAPAQPFSILGAQQEVINGRAAMLGFLVAIATELASGQSVWSQLAGKYANQELIEKPIGASVLFYGFAVIMIALASFAPQVYKGEGPTARSFGPFKPNVELLNGRAAMLGFVALLAVELARGNVALF